MATKDKLAAASRASFDAEVARGRFIARVYAAHDPEMIWMIWSLAWLQGVQDAAKLFTEEQSKV